MFDWDFPEEFGTGVSIEHDVTRVSVALTCQRFIPRHLLFRHYRTAINKQIYRSTEGLMTLSEKKETTLITSGFFLLRAEVTCYYNHLTLFQNNSPMKKKLIKCIIKQHNNCIWGKTNITMQVLYDWPFYDKRKFCLLQYLIHFNNYRH